MQAAETFEPRWCTHDRAGRIFLSRPVESSEPGGRRHAERRHPVEDVAPDFCFGPLIGQSPGIQAPVDNGLWRNIAVSTRLRRL
jgi:hypothetical protein